MNLPTNYTNHAKEKPSELSKNHAVASDFVCFGCFAGNSAGLVRAQLPDIIAAQPE